MKQPIVFIALSSHMAEMATQIAGDMGLDIPIEVGNMDTIQTIVAKYPEAEVLISRGGTTDVLRKISRKMVIGVTTTIGDILEPIRKIAVTGTKKIGVVASGNLIEDLSQDFTILDITILMRPWRENSGCAGNRAVAANGGNQCCG